MRLYTKVLFIALLPLLFSFGYSIYQVRLIMDSEHGNLVRGYRMEGKLVESRLRRLVEDLESTASLISRARPVAVATRAADVDQIHEWTANLLNQYVSHIYILDNDGMVLCRVHDDLRFGDSWVDQPAFRQAREDGSYLGINLVEGEPMLLHARPILLYDEVPVGVVVVATPLNHELLHRLTQDSHSLLVLNQGNNWAGQEPTTEEGHQRWPVKLNLSPGSIPQAQLVVHMGDDHGFQHLERLQMRLLVLTVALAGLAPLLLLMLLRRHLRPYGEMAQALALLADHRIGFENLGQLCARVARSAGREPARMAKSISSLVDTILETMGLLEERNQSLQELTRTDGLTQIANRLHLDDTLGQEMARSRRFNRPMAIILLDVDHFKAVNDTHGHKAGDQVLRRLAWLMRDHVRETDLVGRWGGEEFLVILPGTDLRGAEIWAEKMRLACHQADFGIPGGVTCSFGISQYDGRCSLEDLVNWADVALYQAKHHGRDRVEVWRTPADEDDSLPLKDGAREFFGGGGIG